MGSLTSESSLSLGGDRGAGAAVLIATVVEFPFVSGMEAIWPGVDEGTTMDAAVDGQHDISGTVRLTRMRPGALDSTEQRDSK